MNFYVASKLSNAESVRRVHQALRDDGHTLTYDWTLHGPVWREGWKRCRQVSVFELEGVKDADVVVVLLPGGRGTHVELGAALAMDKHVHPVVCPRLRLRGDGRLVRLPLTTPRSST